MKATYTFNLEISKKEFLKMATPLILNKNKMNKVIYDELYMSCGSIVNGEFGGDNINWKIPFYKNLLQNGYIIQTDYGKIIYGDLSEA